jgi:hypothetical protein
MTTSITYAASPKQASFITDLLASREVDPELAETLERAIADDTLSKSDASRHIDALIGLPKRKAASSTSSPMQTLLASVPKSRYAVPTDALELTDADDSFSGDLAFLEVREYMGTLYMRQLHGAPGRFSRSKLSAASVKAIIGIIAADPYRYTRMFGEHYACCGSCGAELTDQRSRELQLGPECRKKFGF